MKRIGENRISAKDISAATHYLRDCGEIVVFGAVDRDLDDRLFKIRRNQGRERASENGKSYFIQGTLDASQPDLQEAITLLGQHSFARAVVAIFAAPLRFEDGAAHLNHRVRFPRTSQKFVVSTQV